MPDPGETGDLTITVRNLIDFGHHVIPACVDLCRVQAHFFDGYWRDIGTIRAFYEAHMDLTNYDPPFNFYDPGWPIYTHPRYLPGSRLSGCRFNDAILAGGADIQDCTVENSVIGVRTSPGATALTRIRRSASSAAAMVVKLATAALLAEYGPEPGNT